MTAKLLIALVRGYQADAFPVPRRVLPVPADLLGLRASKPCGRTAPGAVRFSRSPAVGCHPLGVRLRSGSRSALLRLCKLAVCASRIMERRVLIAVLLSFLVLYGYQAMFPPPARARAEHRRRRARPRRRRTPPRRPRRIRHRRCRDRPRRLPRRAAPVREVVVENATCARCSRHAAR